MSCLTIRRYTQLTAALFALSLGHASAQQSAPQRVAEPAAVEKAQKRLPRLHGGIHAVPAYRASLPAISEQEKSVLRAANRTAKTLQVGIGRALAQQNRQIALEQVTWTPTDTNGSYTTIEVQSSGAAALRLAIDPRSLPRGITLTAYGTQAPTSIYGPYSTDDLATPNDGDRNPLHWLPAIEGDTARLELYADATTLASKRPLAIPMVSHLLASVRSIEEKDLSDINESGACNIDIACRSAWVSTGNSVAKYLVTDSIGQTGVCTGTLMNSTGPGAPPAYFLTANHCVSTQQEASTLHMYWFFQRPICGGRTPSSVIDTTGGSTLLFTGATNDMTLVQLATSPPAGTVHAGWTTTSLTAGTVITGLHHPAGDLKKYSNGSVLGLSNYSSSTNNNSGSHIRVRWSEGTTEGGSSGSGLFNSNGQLVGTLHGGGASCSSLTNPDWYGRFDQAYPSLQPWLAPTGGTPPVQPPTVPTVIDLASGVGTNGSVALNGVAWYRIASTTAHGSLTVLLGGLSADADLFVHRDSMNVSPTCGSDLTGTTSDTCTVNSPGNATWYIGIDGYRAANFTLTATLTAAPAAPMPMPPRSDNGGSGGGSLGVLLIAALGLPLLLKFASQRMAVPLFLALATISCAGNGSSAATQMSDTTHRIVLPNPTRAEINAPRQTGKGQPLQVGFGRSLSAEQRRVPLARLRWSPMKSSGYAATISVQSPGAKSLRVSGQLSRNVPGLQIAYRDAVKIAAVVPGSTLSAGEPYWSPVIEGDTIIIELRAPAPVQDSTLLDLPLVSHLP